MCRAPHRLYPITPNVLITADNKLVGGKHFSRPQKKHSVKALWFGGGWNETYFDPQAGQSQSSAVRITTRSLSHLPTHQQENNYFEMLIKLTPSLIVARWIFSLSSQTNSFKKNFIIISLINARKILLVDTFACCGVSLKFVGRQD